MFVNRQYEARKNAVLDPGPPHLRLENWYTPLINAYERQLAIKVLIRIVELITSACLGCFSISDIALEKKATYLRPSKLLIFGFTKLEVYGYLCTEWLGSNSLCVP